MAQESIWRLIPEFEHYEINQFGIVRKIDTKQILKENRKSVTLIKENRHYQKRIHNLLFEIFPEHSDVIDLTDFVAIPDIPNYIIHKDGRVWSINSRILMKTWIDKGYIKTKLNSKNYGLHRLLAITFIPNPEGKGEIDHIDRNPGNNSLENLRWGTRSENSLNRARNTEENHNITINKSGTYQVRLQINSKSFCKSFKELPDAIKFRDEIINLNK
jgi:hypothetical protein